MRRCLALLICILLMLPTIGCAAQQEMELIVFAAASLTETLTRLSEMYKEIAPNVSIIFSFESSGTLKTQIEEGAACDIFISAGQKQMDQLDIEMTAGGAEPLDYVLSASRFDILENKLALAVPDGNPAGIDSYDALRAALSEGEILMAMGNADVPVGQYTQRILEYFGLDEAELATAGVLTYGSNVKEVTTQLSEGVVDCGIIYQTDAYSAGLTVVDTAMEKMCGQVVYPAAIMKSCVQREAAAAFLDFLRSDAADAVFEAVGFTPIA